jgi:hypothetical protein
MTARQVLVKDRIHEAGVVERDQHAQAPKRVGRRRPGRRGPGRRGPGRGRAGGAEIGGVQNGVREDRGREKSSRSTTASHRHARHERTGRHRRRGQTHDRPPGPYRREPLPQGGTARTRNDADVHTRAEVADRPPMLIRPRASHNEQYGAQQTPEALPERTKARLIRRSAPLDGCRITWSMKRRRGG